jgi:hypothetical protein
MPPGEPFFSSRVIAIALWFFAGLCAIPVSARTAVVDFPYAVIHYNRPLDDYGDHTTGDFNDFWGLHLWGEAIDAAEGTDWTSPKPFLGEDEFGRFAWIARSDAASQIDFIIHRGDTKDGTNDDRFFDADLNPEIWINAGDATIYTSQAEAQGYVTVRYHRDDGDYGTPTPDFNTFWGLHLWGDAIDPAEGTTWPAPKPPTGIDAYGAFWMISIVDASQPVNFILHRGDTKDVATDEQFLPTDQPTVWRLAGDATLYRSQGAAEEFATLHYHRPAGDYGTPTPDFNTFWGLHVWTGAAAPTGWTNPMPPNRIDIFGAIFEVALVDAAPELAYILHRGDTKDPGPDQFLGFAEWGYEVWQVQGANPAVPYVYPIRDLGDLPVELVEFSVHLDNDRALLNWQTATETNNAGFEVEHRMPDDDSWRRVGFVEGRGTTREPQRYGFGVNDLLPGKHSFRLRQFDYSGTFSYSPEVEISLSLPTAYLLGPAYPNPFNPQATLPFAVAQGGQVQLTLHSVLGQRVRTLFEGVVEPGQTRTVRVDGQALPGGIYFVRLASEGVEANEQVVLLK